MKKALFIVDLQRDFCSGGSLGIPTADAIVPTVNALMDRYDLILASKDWHPSGTVHFEKWPVHCVQDTSGADFHPALESYRINHVFLKGTHNKDDGYSAFEATNDDLKGYLHKHGVEQLDVVGLATDFCVRATVLDALRNDFKVRVLTDAIDAVNLQPGDDQKALDEMKAAGAELVTSATA